MSKLSSQTVKFISLTFGLALIVLGVRHFDFFGYKLVNILGMLIGIFLCILSIMEKEVILMEEKKQKVKRAPSEWNKLCAKVRAEKPGMKAGDVFKLAKSIRDKEKEEKK